MHNPRAVILLCVCISPLEIFLFMFKQLLQKFSHRDEWPSPMTATERPLSPREQFGQIFDIIQLSHTFTDSKTFVDTIPKKRPKRIAKLYQKGYGTQLDLTRFVRDHFELPVALPDPEPAVNESDVDSTPLMVRAHIERMWDVLTRQADTTNKYSSLLPLPHRYIVPGGRFREIYYWDSYFTMLGLRESGKYDLMEDMVKNFAHIISRYGFIPNGNRTYYLTRSQPPMFAMMVELLAEVKGEEVYLAYSKHIYREYAYWMRGSKSNRFIKGIFNAHEHVVRMPNGTLLNRYWDESFSPREESFREDVELGRTMDESAYFYRNMRAGAESGWDYSSRWFTEGGDRSSIRIIELVPVDLNVLLFRTEEILSRIYQIKNKYTLSTKYDKLAQARREAIQTYLWHEDDGWFYDHVHSDGTLSSERTIAGIFPLFAGIATPEQAARMTEIVEQQFLRPGGVATTLKTSGEQWDAPNGWAPLQYVAVTGLDRYGAHALAEDIALRWCRLNISLFEKTGLLYEKYDIENTDAIAGGGEYHVQHGFGWTNGVLLALMNKYHIHTELPNTTHETTSTTT